MPERRAIARVLQCVAFRGVSSSVRATVPFAKFLAITAGP
jgi:hypothetical protein